MWRAMAAQTGLQVVVLGAVVARFDWSAEARRAELGVLEGTATLGDPLLGEALVGEAGSRQTGHPSPAACSTSRGVARRSMEGKVAFPHGRQGVYEPPISSLLD